MAKFARVGRLLGARTAWAAFFAIELAALPFLFASGRRWWFFADDWDFLGTRTAWNLGDLSRPHYGHWVTLPVLAYRGLWEVVGLRSYVPYQALVIGAHLVAVALLRLVMVRAGVGPWLATVFAGVFVVFGAGAENVLVAFQITFVGSFVFGLTQLLLADHDGPIGRRDFLGVLAGLAALMCSGVGIAMAVVVGVAMLLRRGWRVALFHTAPLAIAYVTWAALAPRGQGAALYRSRTPFQVIQFVRVGVQAAFARLVRFPVLAIALGLVLVAGAVLLLRALTIPDRRAELRTRLAAPIALLVGAVVFLLLTGVYRSGQPRSLAGALGVGPARARQSRYVYLVAAMILPALAVAADAVVRRKRWLAVPIVALLFAGVPANLHSMSTFTVKSVLDRDRDKKLILAAPRLPIAARLPRAMQPVPFYGLTIGWLRDSLPSGRIPEPPNFTPVDLANESLDLVVQPAYVAAAGRCETMTRPTARTVLALQRVAVRRGLVAIAYLPPSGPASDPEVFRSRKLLALVGPLRLRFDPIGGPAEVCGTKPLLPR